MSAAERVKNRPCKEGSAIKVGDRVSVPLDFFDTPTFKNLNTLTTVEFMVFRAFLEQ